MVLVKCCVRFHVLTCCVMPLQPAISISEQSSLSSPQDREHSTANLRNSGFRTSTILILRGGIPRPVGNFPESLSQAILVGIILAGRSGVSWRPASSCRARTSRWAQTSRRRGAQGLCPKCPVKVQISQGLDPFFRLVVGGSQCSGTSTPVMCPTE